MISNPHALFKFLPQQIDPVVDEQQRGPGEHLVSNNASLEIRRAPEPVFAVIRPFIEAVERSNEEDCVKTLEE